MTQTERPVRQRRRRVEVAEVVPDDAPRDPLHPGPRVNWPPLPENADGDAMPIPPPHRIRIMYEQDRVAFTQFLFHTLAAMVIAQRPRDDIARAFCVSMEVVDRWLFWLKEEQRKYWMSRDQLDFATEQEASLRRAVAYAWQQAGSTGDSAVKNRWVNTAIRAEAMLMDLYREARIYRTLPVKRAYDEGDDSGDNGVRVLGDQAVRFMKQAVATIPRLPNAKDDVPGADVEVD